MSHNEVPRQGKPVDDFDELEMPPVPARWDDPPSMLSETDLARMAPGRNDDDVLLAAVSEDLWAPVELDETPEADAERLASIIADGAQLRERWAVTAALEEAFTAPPADAVPTQVRMRKTRQEQTLQMHERIVREQQRDRRVLYIRGTAFAAVGATAAYALASNSGFTASIVTNILAVVALCTETLVRISASPTRSSRKRNATRNRRKRQWPQHRGTVMKKPK